MKRLLLLFSLVFIFCDCSLAPVNRFHTAETLKPGKVELGLGAEITRNGADSFFAHAFTDTVDLSSLAIELFGRVGLMEKWDASLRILGPLLFLMPSTMTLNNNFQLHKADASFPDLAVGLTTGYAVTFETVFGSSVDEYNYGMYIFEIPVTISQKIAKHMTPYGGLMFSLYVLDGEEVDNGKIVRDFTDNTMSGTLFAGVDFKFGSFHVRPEVAVMGARSRRLDKTRAFVFPGFTLSFDI